MIVRALLCKEFGPPERLVLEDTPEPSLGPGQVRIAIKACAVNFPDLLIIAGKYQQRPPMPFSTDNADLLRATLGDCLQEIGGVG